MASRRRRSSYLGWEREKLRPDPPDTIAYRRIKVRKRDGGERLITLAITRSRGPRGGRTVAVTIYRRRSGRKRR